MTKIHLLCSVNWNPKAAKPDLDQMLGPLRTMRAHISQGGYDLAKLTLLKGDDPRDLEFCALVLNDLAPTNSKIEVSAKLDSGMPEGIASTVSRAAEDATIAEAELWIDITPGPKQRIAVMFAAASAVLGVRILYSESTQDGLYEVKEVPPLGSYNKWLGRHGIQIRNYCEELSALAKAAQSDKRGSHEELLLTISDLLGSHPELETSTLIPRSNLLPVCEWVSGVAIPRSLFGVTEEQWKGGAENYIRISNDAYVRSAARGAQTLRQLRNIFAHNQPKKEDALALLDCLSFLASRLGFSSQSAEISEHAPDEDRMFIAVDGDDIGRRFEERLAECVETKHAVALHTWSQRIQQELSELMMDLQEKWRGAFLARTGDGFLASFSATALDDLGLHYAPKLTDATVTTGIGRTVKDAYLALKLGKARNRGGGIFYSFDPPEEKILWPAPNER